MFITVTLPNGRKGLYADTPLNGTESKESLIANHSYIEKHFDSYAARGNDVITLVNRRLDDLKEALKTRFNYEI